MSTVEVIEAAGTLVEILGGADMIVEIMDVGAQGPSGNAGLALANGITPAGVKDGVNRNFTLPFDPGLLVLSLRGVVLQPGGDFTRAGVNLQMAIGKEPFADDPFLAFAIGA